MLVSSSYFKCFLCFRRRLQIFHMCVSQVDMVLHGACGWWTAACHSRACCCCWGAAVSHRAGARGCQTSPWCTFVGRPGGWDARGFPLCRRGMGTGPASVDGASARRDADEGRRAGCGRVRRNNILTQRPFRHPGASISIVLLAAERLW